MPRVETFSTPRVVTLRGLARLASSDKASGSFVALAIPAGSVTRDWRLLSFAADSVAMLDDGAPHPVLLGHDPNAPVGFITGAEWTPEGYVIRGQLSDITSRSDTLTLMADGVYGVSVGVAIHSLEVSDDSDVALVTRADLMELSLTPSPALAGARPTEVNFTRSAPADSNTTGATGAGTEIHSMPNTDDLKNALREVLAESAPAEKVGPPAGTTSVTVTREPFVYADGAHSLARDAYMAQTLGDTDAKQRLARANAQVATFTAAESGDFPDAVQSGVYIPARYLPQVPQDRPINAAVSHASISDPRSFRVPYFVSAVNMVGAHTEGDALTNHSGVVTLSNKLIEPGTIDGGFDLTRELIESSSPGLDQIVMDALREGYAQRQESILAALILAATTHTTEAGPAVHLEQKVTEAQLTFRQTRKAKADRMLISNAGALSLVAAADDLNRSLVSLAAPAVNSSSAAESETRFRVGFLTGDVADSLDTSADTLVTLLRAQDVYAFESPVRSFTYADGSNGPGLVRLALFGYYGAALLNAAGVAHVVAGS